MKAMKEGEGSKMLFEFGNKRKKRERERKE